MSVRRRLEAVMAGESPEPWLETALIPLSVLYGWAVAARAGFYKRNWLSRTRLPTRVVSVGNLTVGGSGKTPVVMAMARLLREQGVSTAILSRGYGRREARPGITLVSDGKQVLEPPDVAGDEPVLMAGRLPGVPVLVCPDRVRAGRLAMERFGSQVLLLDDGFQHLSIHRDVDVLLMDGRDPFGNGCLLPRGPLREPVGAMARAHVIVFTGDSPDPSSIETAKQWNPQAHILQAVFQPEALVPLGSWGAGPRAPTMGVDAIRGARILAFAGIAKPRRFWDGVEALGGHVLERMAFKDHHAYGPQDLEVLAARAKNLKVDMAITTEKDAVKLPCDCLGPVPVYALRLEVNLEGSPQWWMDLLTGKGHGA